MKKVLFFAALALPLCALLAATYEVNVPSTTATVPGESSIFMAPEDWELKNDEADPLSGTWGIPVRVKGEGTGGKFKPSGYPFKVSQIGYVPIVWAADTVNWQKAGSAAIFSENLQGFPGSELGKKNISATTPFTEFNWVDVSSLNISIASGSFFAGIMLTSDSEDPETKPGYPACCNDFSPPVHHSSWAKLEFSDGVTRWEPFDSISWTGETWAWGDSVDIMIRVRGTGPTGGVVELEPIALTIEPSATILASEGTVNYFLPEAGSAEITLWDASGRLVKNIYSGSAAAGEHSISWNASDLASGAYFMRLKTASAVKMAKVVLAD